MQDCKTDTAPKWDSYRRYKELKEEMNSIITIHLASFAKRLDHTEMMIRALDMRTQIFVPKRVDNE